MEKKYELMLEFVESKLKGLPFQGYTKVNYSRFDHIKRVTSWALRIYNEQENKDIIDLDSLIIACIFHDVGYCQQNDVDHHQLYSGPIVRKYLEDINYPKDKIDFIEYLVLNHSNKRRMLKMEIPMELVILIEADELDDTGAMALISDCWLETMEDYPTYASIDEHIKNYALHSMDENPLITKAGRKFWDEKMQAIKAFYESYHRDLGDL